MRKVKDLKFIDGQLDVDYMYDKIRNKENIYCELLLVKKALLQYKHSISQYQTIPYTYHTPASSKEFYNMFRNETAEFDVIRNSYLDMYCDDFESIVHAFKAKIVTENEIKLKEFNYKLLYGILSCNKNLKKWKIKDSDVCDVCDQIQTIEHLLLVCNYVKPLWIIVNNTFDIHVQFYQILGLDKSFNYDAIVTLVCFVMYKEWLLLSLDDKERTNTITLAYFKNELNLRLQMYKMCKSIPDNHVENVQTLLGHL